jgi:hypothetical protein
MDINKTTIVISVIVIILCCWAWAIKEPFISGMPLTNTDFNKGISNSIQENQLPVYFKEISVDDMNILLQKVIDRPLLHKLKDRIGTPNIANPQHLEKAASSYIIIAINSLLASQQSAKRFEVLEARIESVRTVDEYDICTLLMIVHREGKHIGFSLKAQVAIISSSSQVSGILDIRALGYIPEDVLLLTRGYDQQAIQGDALSIEHTIMKNAQYEDSVMKQQADGLLKDRGIRLKTNNV